MRRVTSLSVILLILALAVPSTAGEKVDYDFVNRLRAESFHRSQVMDTLQHLTDVIGPRLTGSPGMKAANEWTRDRLAEWGLENAKLESWGEFGRGWSTSGSSAHLIAPRAMPLFIIPQAWTPDTEGAIRGEVMKVLIESFYASVKGESNLPIPYREILLTARIMDAIFDKFPPPAPGPRVASEPTPTPVVH